MCQLIITKFALSLFINQGRNYRIYFRGCLVDETARPVYGRSPRPAKTILAHFQACRRHLLWKQFLSQEQCWQLCSCDKNCLKEMSLQALKCVCWCDKMTSTVPPQHSKHVYFVSSLRSVLHCSMACLVCISQSGCRSCGLAVRCSVWSIIHILARILSTFGHVKLTCRLSCVARIRDV